jgi:hypothetical protein
VQHSIDSEPRIRHNSRFTDQSGSGNPDRRVNHPNVVHDREELSRRLEQTEEHVMMVGSWPCKMPSEILINGQHVSEPIHEDKGKMMATELEDEKDLKRVHVVLSKGHEVVGLGYSRLAGAVTKVTKRGENSGNPSLVNRVSKMEKHYPRRVSRVSDDNSTDWQAYQVSRVSQNRSTCQ